MKLWHASYCILESWFVYYYVEFFLHFYQHFEVAMWYTKFYCIVSKLLFQQNLFFLFPDNATETSFEGKKSLSVMDIRYEEACNRLAVEAVKRGCTDNVTVMVVDIALKDSKNGNLAPKT